MAIGSAVAICNLALLRLGTNTITSLNDGTTASNACLLVYDHSREALLRRHFWNFAIVNSQLAADVTAPVYKYTYQYPLPSDFLRVREIYDQYSDYDIDGNAIHTNDSAPLKLSYVSNVTDPTKFDSLFVESLVLTIIIKIGARIQGDGFNPGQYLQELERALLDAKRVDAQDASPKQLQANTFTTTRWAGTSFLDPSGKSYMEY